MAGLAAAFEAHMAYQAFPDGWRPYDVVAAAAWLWPDLFTFEPTVLAVSPNERGRLIRGDGVANAEVCIAVNAEAVRERVLRSLFAAPA
jgi:inosine-uridine nucleoside N-ribohydrolase